MLHFTEKDLIEFEEPLKEDLIRVYEFLIRLASQFSQNLSRWVKSKVLESLQVQFIVFLD